MRRMAMEFGEQTKHQATINAGKMFLEELSAETFISSVRSSVSTFTFSLGTRVFDRPTTKTTPGNIIRR